MKQLDLRQVAIARLWASYYNKLVTNAVKDDIRNNNIDNVIGNDYCAIIPSKQTNSRYSDEDQAKIDRFIADNHIKKIKETKEDYKLEFVPSEKAIKLFNQMLEELQNSQHRNIVKIAERVIK